LHLGDDLERAGVEKLTARQLQGDAGEPAARRLRLTQS
jgi:hypothetical protein